MRKRFADSHDWGKRPWFLVRLAIKIHRALNDVPIGRGGAPGIQFGSKSGTSEYTEEKIKTLTVTVRAI